MIRVIIMVLLLPAHIDLSRWFEDSSCSRNFRYCTDGSFDMSMRIIEIFSFSLCELFDPLSFSPMYFNFRIRFRTKLTHYNAVWYGRKVMLLCLDPILPEYKITHSYTITSLFLDSRLDWHFSIGNQNGDLAFTPFPTSLKTPINLDSPPNPASTMARRTAKRTNFPICTPTVVPNNHFLIPLSPPTF